MVIGDMGRSGDNAHTPIGVDDSGMLNPVAAEPPSLLIWMLPNYSLPTNTCRCSSPEGNHSLHH